MHWYSKKVRTTRLCLKSPTHEYINRHRTIFFSAHNFVSIGCPFVSVYTLHTNKMGCRFGSKRCHSCSSHPHPPFFFHHNLATWPYSLCTNRSSLSMLLRHMTASHRTGNKKRNNKTRDVYTLAVTNYTLLGPGSTQGKGGGGRERGR